MARPTRITDHNRLQPANDIALRLDIEVSELRYDLQPRSIHAKRLVAIREAVLDARRLIEDFQNEIAEAQTYEAEAPGVAGGLRGF